MADGAYMMVWDNATSSWVKTLSSSGILSVNVTNQSEDMFEQVVTAGRYNQVEISFDQTDPDLITDVTVTKTSGGDAVNSNGQAVFSTGTNTNGGIKCVTNSSVAYRPNAEIYADFSCIYSAGLANSYQRIGCYNANNGFFIGYEGTSFGVTIRKAGVDTTTPQTSFNIDKLTGQADSKFTRNGVPEALDTSKDNLYRIRFGWLGAAPVIWEVMSPDGQWVIFHIYRHPNTVAATSINDPDLPITLDIQKTGAGATNLTISTACWAIGTSSDLQKVSSTLTDNTLVKPVRSVLVAKMPSGSYTNIDATAGGNLKVSLEEVDGAVTIPISGTVTANLAAGTNYVGKVRLTDGTTDAEVVPLTGYNAQAVAIVDGSGNQITSFGGGTQYIEDNASAGGETGTMLLAVRNDAAAAKTSADGDFSAIAVDSAGRVGISDLGGSITVDGTFWQATQPVSNAGVFAVQDSNLDGTIYADGYSSLPSEGVCVGGKYDPDGTHPEFRYIRLTSDGHLLVSTGGINVLQVDNSSWTTSLNNLDINQVPSIVDNSGFVDGNTKLAMAGYIYDEVAGTALTENDVAAARIDAKRAQIGTIEDGTTRGRYATVTAANAVKVDGSAVTQPVSGTFWQATQPVSLASVPSHPVTNAGTFAVQVDGAALTALQLLDDTVITDNAGFTDGTTKLSISGFIFDEVAGTALTENDAAAARIDAKRAQIGTIEDGVTRGRYATVTAANAVKVDGSAVTQPVSGTFWQATQPVSLASVPSHPVTNAGTFAVQVDGAALTALQLLDDTIIADDAAFTVGTTKVNMAGGYAVAHGANPDAADAGDAGAILMNRHRIPFMIGGHPNTVSAEYLSTGNITDDNILPAIASGTKYIITGITVAASAANTTNATVRIGFGATTVPTQGATNADAVAKVVMSLPGIPPGGGAVKGNGGGIVGVGGDGEELRVTITNMASGNLTIVVDYYTIES